MAGNQLHHQIVHTIGLFETEDRRDVGVVQGGQHSRFALKTSLPFSVVHEGRRKNLDGYVASELGVMSLIHLAHSSCTQQRNNLEGPELPPYERGLTLIFSQNFCRHFHRGPFQKFFRPVLLCQQRFHFLQQLFVPYAHLAQICRSLAFFAFQRRVIHLLDFLPAFRRHFHSPRTSPSPASAKPWPASNRAGPCRVKLSAP